VNAGLDARGLPSGYPFKPDLEITPREVKAAMAEIYLIDCRTQAEWATANIPGAVLIPLHTLESRVNDIEAQAGDKPVVVLCHMGGRSMKAALFLRGRGIDAKSMAGGIEAWSLGVDPAVPRY
jgi:rhodanese-related sulfurtransferase